MGMTKATPLNENSDRCSTETTCHTRTSLCSRRAWADAVKASTSTFLLVSTRNKCILSTDNSTLSLVTVRTQVIWMTKAWMCPQSNRAIATSRTFTSTVTTYWARHSGAESSLQSARLGNGMTCAREFKKFFRANL